MIGPDFDGKAALFNQVKTDDRNINEDQYGYRTHSYKWARAGRVVEWR